ncbi:hypothetical protein ANANG_G00000460 [Anguilla anguilla]|uniref:Uncharacterized protein n=1 Tax=Anguilla anguilla TaxID=7936 RepID=A0A9D3MY05_ANGAN|nr:hypothetical protein ANANG_G00000460 [Anguilla anguilla]
MHTTFPVRRSVGLSAGLRSSSEWGCTECDFLLLSRAFCEVQSNAKHLTLQLSGLKMLRLLILCLVLSTAVTSEEVDDEPSGDGGDDEDGLAENDVEGRIEDERVQENFAVQTEHGPANHDGRMIDNVEKAQANDEKEGVTSTIVIAVVCVVALAAVAIAAAILVRRHMLNRQQGVYSVPVEQSEKPAI